MNHPNMRLHYMRLNFRLKVQLRTLAIATTASALLAISACSTRTPAPIVNRTAAGNAAAQAPLATVPLSQVPSTPAASTQTQNNEAQAAPVRSATVDTKPLETKPFDTKSGPSATTSTGSNAMRTQPKGLKRPYSDTLLADLKAADAPPLVAAPVAPVLATTTAADSKAGPLSLGWPSAGKLIQTFGKDKSTGMAFGGKLGDNVMAAADGKVIFSNTTLPQYGKMIIVKHDDDTHTVYAHNKNLLVKEGQQVKKGQKIAELGDTGTTQPKLYFEVRRQGKPIDPQKLLPTRS